MTPTTLAPTHVVHHLSPRVTGDDDLFIRMDRALGVPLANQVVWKLDTVLSGDRFAALGARLARTSPNRVLRRTRVPLARDVWIDAGAAGSVRTYDADPVADDAVIDWMNQCVATTFNLTDGPVWAMRAAPLAGGGSIVSLVSSHAVGDGWAGIATVLASVDPSATTVGLPTSTPPVAADIRDAATQLARITTGLGGLALDSICRREVAARPVVTSQSIARPTEPVHNADYHPTLAIVGFDSEQWRRVARAHGGTPNALFIALTAGLVVAAGRATWDDDIRIIVPMSRRDEVGVDLRANVTTGLALDLPTTLSLRKDLAGVRSLAKLAYRNADDRPDPLTRLQPLVQSLSDAALMRMNRDAATPLAVASNIGELPDRFASLGTEGPNAVALRSIPQHSGADTLARLRGGLACWLNSTGSTTTLSVGSYDPIRVPTQSALTTLLDDECARWALTPRRW